MNRDCERTCHQRFLVVDRLHCRARRRDSSMTESAPSRSRFRRQSQWPRRPTATPPLPSAIDEVETWSTIARGKAHLPAKRAGGKAAATLLGCIQSPCRRSGNPCRLRIRSGSHLQILPDHVLRLVLRLRFLLDNASLSFAHSGISCAPAVRGGDLEDHVRGRTR